MLEERGALLEEEGDLVREYKAMHDGHFLCSCLREDVEGMEKPGRDAQEQEGKSGKREVAGERDRVEVNSKRVCFGRSSLSQFSW